RGPKASMSVDTKNYTVWVSNDFDGDVATATWTQIAIPTHGTTPWGYVNSGNMVIPDANCAANCRIAWKYVCDDKESATWEIKNIIVK
ncbi:MAG: choice-of-anchor J domain-containing protein, partial [Alistipes sp.]|nr:choice-of-anchor J domain-containing protein [Candidatus Alistipes equi]